MKKIKNVFFMLLIVMSMVCTAVYAEPAAENAASPDTAAQTEATPEPTVAPELADNQIHVSTGAKSVTFTINHKDTVDISIISPSQTVLTAASVNVTTKSVSAGTVVTVSNPEPGVWTMNASSTIGEVVTVESKCEYNMVIDLQCENGVIYSGVSGKFFAFVKTTDGSDIDPNALRTSTMMLYIQETDSDKPKTVDMTFKGAAFETSYTYNDVGKLIVWAEANINNTTIESEPMNVISIPSPDKGDGLPIWAILLIVVAATGLGVYCYIHFSDKMKNTKGSANMTGTVSVSIDVGGNKGVPTTRNLAMLGNSVGMLTLIGDDEYYDVDGITLSGAAKGLRVVNKSRCEVLFSNVGADPGGVTLLDNQFFKIFMPDEKTVITVTYHSDDVFTSLINTAAAEQQKQLEQQVQQQEEPEQILADVPDEQNQPEGEIDTSSAVAEEVEKPADEPEASAEDTNAEAEPAAADDTTVSDTADSFETAPALESFSFDGLTEDAEKPSTEPEADEEVEPLSSFTIDTSDAVEIEKPDEEEYSFDTPPALEDFNFSGLTDTQTEDVQTSDNNTEDITDSASEADSTDMFADLASLAANIAGEAVSDNSDDAIESADTEDFGIDLSALASLAADAVDESADTSDKEQDAPDGGIAFDDLASLAADVADESEKE